MAMKKEDGSEMKQEQAAKIADRLTVRIIEVRNGYIVKTNLGQFVYDTLDETLNAVEKHYNIPL